MDIYIATSDYVADVPGGKVMNLHEGMKYAILEEDVSSRHHQEWWGVISLSTDNEQVGYAPAKYLQFSERIPEEGLPLDYKAERERHLRQLDTMQQEDDAPLPDIYKVPPVQVQSIDEWTNAEDDKDPLDYRHPRTGSPYRDHHRQRPLPAQNGRSSGVVLRPKQEKTDKSKSVKTRKSFIDRLFGSKHKDKESKKEKKKGKANRQYTDYIRTESPQNTVPIHEEEPSVETQEVKLTVVDDDPEDHSDPETNEDDAGDTKENKPPVSNSEEGAGAMALHDYSDDDSQRDNNNRSMTEDEWKKLIDDVENDMAFPDPPEPEVDYHDEDNENDVPNGTPRIIQPVLQGSLEDLPKHLRPASSTENLVMPKKLHNPVVSSALHQDLHREMESNRRMGVNVLQQKTELKKEFERREDRQKKKEREEIEKKKKTEIQKRLEEQKQKYDEQDKGGKEKAAEEEQDGSGLSEFQRMRSKLFQNKAS